MIDLASVKDGCSFPRTFNYQLPSEMFLQRRIQWTFIEYQHAVPGRDLGAVCRQLNKTRGKSSWGIPMACTVPCHIGSSQQPYEMHVEKMVAWSAHGSPEIPQFGHEGELQLNLVF